MGHVKSILDFHLLPIIAESLYRNSKYLNQEAPSGSPADGWSELSYKAACLAGQAKSPPAVGTCPSSGYFLVWVPSGVPTCCSVSRALLKRVWLRSSSATAVTRGCVVVVPLPSHSLHTAYKRSPVTVHLVLSQSLFMCLKPPIEHGTLSNQLSKLGPGVQ